MPRLILRSICRVNVVSHLVGLPEGGRERMLEWGSAAFDSLGPANARCLSAAETAMGLVHYALQLEPGAVRPGSWAALAFEAAERGEITLHQARGLILDYVAPSLDTTIFATSNALWLFALHPESWDSIREQSRLDTRRHQRSAAHSSRRFKSFPAM